MEFTSDPSTGIYLSPKPQNLTIDSPKSDKDPSLILRRAAGSDDIPEMNQRPRTSAVRPNNMEDPEYMEVDYTDSRSHVSRCFLASSVGSQPPGQSCYPEPLNRSARGRHSDESDK